MNQVYPSKEVLWLSCCSNYNFHASKTRKKISLFNRYFFILTSLIFLSAPLMAQCPVTPCETSHQTFVDLSKLPECGTGTIDLLGDLQNNQSDCQNGTINCHEFIIWREEGSPTQQFTLKVGQGAGCTGELDASYSSIDGVCTTLSNGGSGTFITFTYPDNVDTIYLFFCLNSGAQISICDLCAEPPPVSLIVNCPPEDGGTFTCIDEVPAPDFTLIDISDSNGEAIVTVDDDTTGTGCGTDTMFLTRTYYITDSTGVDSCVQIFRVLDNRLPVIMNCPAAITVSCDSQVPVATTNGITATDNCDQAVTISFTGEVMSNFICADRYTIIRTFQATDDCGNSSTCTQAITVSDNTAPIFSFVPSNTTISCDDTPTFGIATASDNCGSSVLVTFTTSTNESTNCAGGTSTRVFTATDVCGNTTTSSQTLTFVDIQSPVFTFVPANSTIACDAAPVFGIPIATDNCDSSVVISFTTSLDLTSNCAGGTSTRIFTATDNCGNSATASQIITFTDTEVPAFVFVPADATVDCSSVPLFGTATAIDNCDSSVVITFTTSSDPSSTCAGGVTTRTFTATDDCGNTSTADQTLTFVDSEAPSITCPSTLSVSCASLVPLVDLDLVVTSDNCDDAVTVTFDGDVITNQTCADNFTLTRTFRATDACGNSATCSQIITVLDNTGPIITCPGNVTVECASLVPAVNISGVITSNNCGGTATVTFVGDVITNQTCADRYTLTRTYRATDACGNSATCSQIITVSDDTAPIITCPANITVECASLVLAPNTGDVTTTSNCEGTATVTFVGDVITNQTCADNYTLTRTFSATDSCGNSATCNQIITVLDNTAPNITCPVNVTVECATLVPAVNIDAIITSNNCGGSATVTFVGDVITNQTCADRYTVTRTYSATDACGNVATCSQIITVFDDTVPTLTCPANVTVECASLMPAVNISEVVTSNNCGGTATVAFVGDVITNQTCADRYTVTRSYSATDACGNVATCSQIITVFDDTVPTLTCPADITVECASLMPAVNISGVVTSNNCGGTATVAFVGDVISNQTCADRYTVTRTYSATDACGNVATCSQIITVFDDTVPTLTCPADITVECASLVPASNTGEVTTTSNCGGTATVTFVGDVITNQTCADRYTLTRTYSATDACGNSATCSQIITVMDNTAPIITCPANVTVECASLVPIVNLGAVTTTNNCGGSATVTFVGDVITNQTCADRYTLTRTYSATDACGNSATCSQIITVMDNTAPIITCPANVTVECASLVPIVNLGAVTTTNNCGGSATVTFVGDEISNQTCVNRFTVTRTYRATDACGNSANCSQIITVFDNTAPVITFTDPLLVGVPNGGTVEVQCYGQDPAWDLPGFETSSVSVTDNCAGDVSTIFTPVLVGEGDCDVDGYIVRYRMTWTATDACGNSSSAFVFMDLIDTIAPVIFGVPEDVTVSCNEIPELPVLIYATDECLCACIVLSEETEPAEGCQNGQVIVRTWTAVDDCGNMRIETQNITLVDEDGPEMVMMQPELVGVRNGSILEYTCNEGGIPEFFDDLNEESVSSLVSCGITGTTSFNAENHIANNCDFWGYLENRVYTWKMIDQCGNESIMIITARLVDREAPQLVGVPDTTCIGDPMLREIEAIDNCNTASVKFWDVAIQNPCGNGMATRRTYEANDGCGNIARDTAILIPNDASNPTIEFISPALKGMGPDETLQIECSYQGSQYSPYGIGDVKATDGCGSAITIRFEERLVQNADCQNGTVATGELVWTATDVCGNSSQLVMPVNVVDETGPELLNFHSEITIGCNDELPWLNGTDNCGEVRIVSIDSIIPGSCIYQYEVLRRITATDLCGNTTSRIQRVRVGSDGPVIEGVIAEVCDDLSMPEVTAFDPCTGDFVAVQMVEEYPEVDCTDGRVIERIWSATDACGNRTEIHQRIIMGDTTAPEIQVPTYSVIRYFLDEIPNDLLLSEEELVQKLSDLDESSVFVLDDCDQQIDPVFTLQVVFADSCEQGFFEHRTYTWLATDICGNADSISFSVNIIDDMPPLFPTIPGDTVIVCDSLPIAPVLLALDGAQPVTMTYTEEITAGENPGEFLVIRKTLAVDACGNLSQIDQTVFWMPETLLECDIILPEVVECNSHGVVITGDITGGIDPLTYYWEITGDKCFIQGGQNTPEIQIYVGFSDVEITLTVTDAFGCRTMCTAVLSCQGFTDGSGFINPQGLNTEFIDGGITPQPNSGNASDLKILENFNLWPNPAQESVNLSFDSSTDEEVQITLTDFLGQNRLNDQLKAVTGFNTSKLDVSHIQPGSYILQVKTDSEIHTKIIVIMQN